MIFFLNSIDHTNQISILKDVSKIISESPFFCPRTPKFNNPFNIKISNAGSWGWISDVKGYRYVNKHPLTNQKWPKIPQSLLEIWKNYCKYNFLPDSCLINLYTFPESKLGLHQDKDEKSLEHPVLSISLGSSAIFKYGEEKKKLNEICLTSGSLVIMEGSSRLNYHGVTKIIKTSKNIINMNKYDYFPIDCRVNITLRRYEL